MKWLSYEDGNACETSRIEARQVFHRVPSSLVYRKQYEMLQENVEIKRRHAVQFK